MIAMRSWTLWVKEDRGAIPKRLVVWLLKNQQNQVVVEVPQYHWERTERINVSDTLHKFFSPVNERQAVFGKGRLGLKFDPWRYSRQNTNDSARDSAIIKEPGIDSGEKAAGACLCSLQSETWDSIHKYLHIDWSLEGLTSWPAKVRPLCDQLL